MNQNTVVVIGRPTKSQSQDNNTELHGEQKETANLPQHLKETTLKRGKSQSSQNASAALHLSLICISLLLIRSPQSSVILCMLFSAPHTFWAS